MNHDVTRILSEIEQGNADTAEQLLPLVYKELRRLAAAKMAQESPDHSLQATGLVHEAFLRLVDTSTPQAWQNRGHFFAAAGESMRRILVECARRRATKKRGGDVQREPLDDADIRTVRSLDELLDVHDVLDRLAEQDIQAGELVKLRYFAGLDMDETASALGISVRKAHYIWAYARSWLRRELDNH